MMELKCGKTKKKPRKHRQSYFTYMTSIMVNEERGEEIDIMDRIACRSISSSADEFLSVDSSKCIMSLRSCMSAIDTMLTNASRASSKVAADSVEENDALLAALPSGVPRVDWRPASASLPIRHAALESGHENLAAVLSQHFFVRKTLDGPGEEREPKCVSFSFSRMSSNFSDQLLLGVASRLLSAHGSSSDARVDAANDALSVAQIESSESGQAYIIRDRALFGPLWESLTSALAHSLLEHESALSAVTARHIAETALILSRRSRCASIALSAVARIVNLPGAITAVLDAAFVPAVSASVLSAARVSSSQNASGATIITRSFGPCLRTQTPFIVVLHSALDVGSAAEPVVVGRFLVVVTHEFGFVSTSPQKSGPSFGSLCEAGEGGVSVFNGRVDVAWAPGDDEASARGVLLYFDPASLTVMLRTPQTSLLPDSSAPRKTVGIHLGKNAHMRSAISTTGAAGALAATAAALHVVRATKGTSTAVEIKAHAIGTGVKAGGVARISLTRGDEEIDSIVRALDSQSGRVFAESGWQAELSSFARADRSGGGIFSASARPASPVALPISHTQLFAWGAGSSGQLGIGDMPTSLPMPSPLAFAGELGIWRVAAIACGWHHTVLLTDTGTVYTWGNGGDGQLGTGETSTSPIPRLVDFFGLTHPLTVVAIAANSDSSGSHTLVIARGNLNSEVDENAPPLMPLDDRASGRFSAASSGRVFSWGVDPAVGRGGFEPVLLPKLVRADAAIGSEMYDKVHGGVVAIAAGGGFSLALTRSGALFSWGKYANGRLGLGTPPMESTTVNTRPRRQTTVPTRARIQANPTRVTKGLLIPDDLLVASSSIAQPGETVEAAPKLRLAGTVIDCAACEGGKATLPLRSIAAGEAHSIALDVFGLIWTWGHGGGGALGSGSTRDLLAPRRLDYSHPNGEPVRFSGVAAGSAHSLAISVDNSLYSWGGAGRGTMLGHSDGILREQMSTVATAVEFTYNETLASTLPSALRSRMRVRRKAETLQVERSSAGLVGEDEAAPIDDDYASDEEIPLDGEKNNSAAAVSPEVGAYLLQKSAWLRPWLRPRPVRVFDGSSVSTRVVATGGGWGHSWALTTAGELYAWGDNSAGQLGVPPSLSTVAESLPRRVGTVMGATSSISAFSSTYERSDRNKETTTLAAYAAASSLLRLPSETVVCVASGGWHMIAVSCGSYEGMSLRQAWPLSKGPASRSRSSSLNTSVLTSSSTVASQGNQENRWFAPEIFSSPGASQVRGYDIRLRSNDGHELSAHRAILAARSSVLAKRLAVEANVIPSRARRVLPLLLLPDLSASVASALLEWIYTDRLSVPLSPTDAFTRQVAAAANAYGITHLSALCTILTESPVVYWTRQVDSVATEDDASKSALLPLSSLTDVSQLVLPIDAAAAQQKAAFDLTVYESSLPAQLMRLLLAQPPMWRDVVFIADGWRFSAHGVIVCSACEYFQSILGRTLEAKRPRAYFDNERTGEDDGDDDGDNDDIIEIALPDSAATVMRLLAFMYSGSLPPLPSCAEDANANGIFPGIFFPVQPQETALVQPGAENREPIVLADPPDSPEKAATSVGAHKGAKQDDGSIPAISSSPSVPSSWTPQHQLICDIVAADRYGLTSLSSLAASLLEVTPQTAAQVLEVSELLPNVPRLREAAILAATQDLKAFLSSSGYASMRSRTPQLMNAVLSRLAQDHDSAFFRGLAAELAEKIAPRISREATDREEENERSVFLSKSLGRLTWQPVVALIAVAGLFTAFAEYNMSSSWHVPVINIGVLLVAAILVYNGTINI